jgi:hypothetical protein
MRQFGHADLLNTITRRYTSPDRRFDKISSTPDQTHSQTTQEAITTAGRIDYSPSGVRRAIAGTRRSVREMISRQPSVHIATSGIASLRAAANDDRALPVCAYTGV